MLFAIAANIKCFPAKWLMSKSLNVEFSFNKGIKGAVDGAFACFFSGK